MRKLTWKIVLLTAVVIAMLAVPAIVSAGVQRWLMTTYSGYDDHWQNNGIMFDIVANKDITLTSIETNLGAGSVDPTIKIYYKPGTFVGFESDPGAWTLVGSDTMDIFDISGIGLATPIPIDLSSISLAAGETGALYVDAFEPMPDHARIYTTPGTGIGVICAQNDDLEILEGISVENAGTGFIPGSNRIPNVTIHYEVDNVYTMTATADPGGSVSPSSGDFYVDAPVTVTATPDPGYHFVSWLVTWPGDLPSSVDVYANPLTFDMPEGDVEVVARFAEDEPKPPTPPTPPVKPVIPPTGDSVAMFIPMLTVIAGLAVASVPTLRKRRER